jgi:hypothetical protein
MTTAPSRLRLRASIPYLGSLLKAFFSEDGRLRSRGSKLYHDVALGVELYVLTFRSLCEYLLPDVLHFHDMSIERGERECHYCKLYKVERIERYRNTRTTIGN